jgi:hypothetical protein
MRNIVRIYNGEEGAIIALKPNLRLTSIPSRLITVSWLESYRAPGLVQQRMRFPILEPPALPLHSTRPRYQSLQSVRSSLPSMHRRRHRTEHATIQKNTVIQP